MKQTEPEFLASAASKCDFPATRLPEIVLAGRSNVGKSSLINKLAGAKIARIGSAPGTTRSINFYRIENLFVFVDLPGYGYAKAAKPQKQHWKRLVEDYFRDRRVIALAIHLVDARLAPTAGDLLLARFLGKYSFPRVIVATKADKLSGNRRAAQERVISSTFGQPVLMCSAASGMGCREIWNRLVESARGAIRSVGHPPA